MIWTYKPYKNPSARKLCLAKLSPLYVISSLLIIGKFLKSGLSIEFILPTLALSLMLSLLTALILVKPKIFYTDENYIHISGKKIKKIDAEYIPDFKNLKVKIKSSKIKKTVYFEKIEDMKEFLREVGYTFTNQLF